MNDSSFMIGVIAVLAVIVIAYQVIHSDSIVTVEQCTRDVSVIKVIPHDENERPYYCFQEDNSGYDYEGDYYVDYDRWDCHHSPITCSDL